MIKAIHKVYNDNHIRNKTEKVVILGFVRDSYPLKSLQVVYTLGKTILIDDAIFFTLELENPSDSWI